MSRIDDLIAEMCPDGVEYQELGNLVIQTSKVNWSAAEEQEFRYIDLTSVNRITHEIQGIEVITAETAPSGAQQVVHEGDVLFGTTRPMLRRFCFVPAEFDRQIASTGYCVLRVDSSRLLSRFLFHLLGSSPFYAYVEENQRGASYPAIPDSTVKQYRIPVPPMEVQREIVRILDTFSALEAELEAELDARRVQYAHYCVHLIDGLFTELCQDEVVLEPLVNVGTWYGGGTPSKSRLEYWRDGAIPWVSPKDMGRPVVTKTEDYITEAAVRGSSTKLVPPMSIAMVVRSSILDRVLPTALIPIPVALNQDMKAVVPRDDILPGYIAHLLRTRGPEILRVARKSGGSVASIESSRLFSYRIPVPPMDVQREIVRILDTLSALEADLEAELEARRAQYEHYRDRLLTFEEAPA